MESTGLSSRERREDWVVLAIIAAQLCLVVPLAAWLNIWIDESYSLATSVQGPLEAFRRAHSVEQQPPLYFVLLSVWRMFNPSIAFARMLSVLFVALGLWASHRAARRWFNEVAPAWLLAPLAFNVCTLYAATEIRVYGLVFLWMALLMLLFHDGFCGVAPSRRAQFLYALVAALALYTFYFSGFFLVAGAAVLLAQRQWRRLAEYCAFMAAVGIVFLPEMWKAASSANEAMPLALNHPGVFQSLEFVGSRMVALPFGLTYLPDGVRLPVSVLAIGTVGAALWSRRGRIPAAAVGLWITFGVVAFFYGIVVWRVMGTILSTRHLIVALLPAMFAVFSIAALLSQRRRAALVIWVVTGLGFSGAASAIFFAPMAKGGDFRRVAQYLQAHEQPGQRIVIVPPYTEVPLGYYYQGLNPLVALPERDFFEDYDRRRWRFESEEQVAALLSDAIPKESSFWVLTDYPKGDLGNSAWSGLNLDFFENVLARDYEQVSEQDFYATKIRFFRRK